MIHPGFNSRVGHSKQTNKEKDKKWNLSDTRQGTKMLDPKDIENMITKINTILEAQLAAENLKEKEEN